MPSASKPARSAALACSSSWEGLNSSVEAANQNWVMPFGLPAARGAKRAPLRPFAPRIAAQQRTGAGPRGERQRLRRIVEGERPRAEIGADDLAPAPRQQLVRLAAVGRPGAVSARVGQ